MTDYSKLTTNGLVQRIAEYEEAGLKNPIGKALYGDLLEVAKELANRLSSRPKDGWVSAKSVEWVVNDNAELGVKIGDRFFFLYKGASLEYEDAKHDDGSTMMWRHVGKREFGECCHPIDYWETEPSGPTRFPGRYLRPLLPGIHLPGNEPDPEDLVFKPMPAAPKENTNED